MPSPYPSVHGAPVTTPAAIRFDQVSLAIAKRPILTDLSFEVPSGAVLAIVGPSGSGKSSVLKLINRLWDLTPGVRVTGTVWFGSTNVYDRRVDVTALRTHIGMVFQRPTPFPKSIYQNIALPLAIHGTPRAQIPERVEAALTQVGLWQDVSGRLHASALTLSGGQQQRLSIARALALKPAVLLLDEPASALDPKSRHTIDELIQTLRGHTTVILVTHHLEQAREVATHIGVLINGRLEALGVPDEIFRSTHPPVAQYLHHAQ
ncbi:phosphate import ATP-binding protein [Sulfobacillus acidophilus TPY]|uniref:Phosphate-transporting ATPase n=1 Tax=Sulfobacillus acidophilus (strain ATCC 700253 / DSM 10332 / NAL) TaxID=679936 RepID=G8TTG2_SULAD|nr:phosphate import ATP-binding protein [Sulfobacillus acidophilus TPY]AEW04542.1 Phosphate-transporting ATPase [Sulfobacillus acidophilus DSM 10332]